MCRHAKAKTHTDQTSSWLSDDDVEGDISRPVLVDNNASQAKGDQDMAATE